MDSLVECEICTNLRPPYAAIHLNDNGSRMEPNPLHASHPMCATCLITRYDAVEQCPICRGRYERPSDALAVRDAEADNRVAEQMPFRNTDDVFDNNTGRTNPIVARAVEAIRNSRPPRRVNRLARGARAAQHAERQQEETVVIPDRHCCWRKERRTEEYPVDGKCLKTVIHPSTIDNRDYCEDHYDDGPYEMMLLTQKLENQKLEKSAKNKKRLGEQLLKEQTKKAQLVVMSNASVTYFQHLSQASGALSNALNARPVQQPGGPTA